MNFNPQQRRIFTLTYVTYASYYLARLSLSVALPAMELDLGLSRFTMGLIAGTFSLSYAIGQFVNGQLAENVGAKNLIFSGLILSAAMNLLFGYADGFILWVIIWGINGYAQSTGWSCSVKIIRNWFKSDVLGSIGGLFGSCFLVGNMAAWFILGWALAEFGWHSVFLVPILPLVIMSFIFYRFASDEPESQKATNKHDLQRIKFNLLRILSSRRLITIALAYALLQFVRSGFTLWAPTFVFERYNLPLGTASYVASIIPLGGIVGAIISGWLSDRMKKFGRTPFIFTLTFLLSVTIFVLYNAPPSALYIGIILLFTSGFMLYAPHIIMVTIVPMEEKDSYGVSGVAGFIDGVGYISLMFADPLTGWILDMYGWNRVMFFWLAISLASALLTLTLWHNRSREKMHV